MTAMRALLLALLVAAVVAAAVAAAVGLPLTPWLAEGAAWAQYHPYATGALFIAAYALAAVLAVPGTILTLAAGFAFGVPLGVALVSFGSVLGAVGAFLLGRFVTRAWVVERIADRPRFRALDAATREDGLAIVLLARLSPLFPYNLLNYAFALTAVRLRDYVLGSWLGMLPATVLYVYLGSLARGIAALTSGGFDTGRSGGVLFALGFLATLGLTVVIARRATRALRGRLATQDGAGPGRGAQ
jgi:uncharacterized membrane protein YdjX (TVP38/TMEM64 family)